MKGCIGIISRLDSKRLKNKPLIKINKKPVLSYLIDRIKKEFKDEINNNFLDIIILTGNKEKNKNLSLFAIKSKIKFFFGDDKNIPERIYKALISNNYDYIISIDGDDILCSVNGMRKIYEQIVSGSSSYAKTRRYPFGMNSFGLKRDFLKKSISNKKSGIMETGWTAIFDKKKKCDFVDDYYSWDKRLRFTLDYPEDLKFFKAIINSSINIVSAQHKEIIDYVLKKKIYNYNVGVISKYWKNYRKNKY